VFAGKPQGGNVMPERGQQAVGCILPLQEQQCSPTKSGQQLKNNLFN